MFENHKTITSNVNRNTVKLILFLSFMGIKQNKFKFSKESNRKLEIRWKNTAVEGSSSAVLATEFFPYGSLKSIIILGAEP